MTETLPLLAKGLRSGRPPLTLAQHLRDTEFAAELVFRLDRRWGVAFCRFFRIDERDRPRFLLNLRVAALFHDLGKANEEFQRAVTVGNSLQSLRHEHISALILHLPEVRGWLAAHPDLDVDIITAAVLSHHLKASEDDQWTWGQSRRADVVTLRLKESQVEETLTRVSEVTGLPPLRPFWPGRWHDGAPWGTALSEGRRAATRLRRSLQNSSLENAQRKSLLLAVKAAVIVADSVASGVVREGYGIDAWIDDVVHRPPLEPQEVHRHIIQARLDQVTRSSGLTASLQPFQEMVANRGPRVLLLAPCGAGKSLAAWSWARQQLEERAAGRVIFLYPTRGTATEGFRDYVGWAPETDAELLHATSRYELEEMQANPTESIAGKSFTDEAAARLFALGRWPKRYFSATVDQFLGFMEHRYESLCLLPALADSVVIFDEVHSYDKDLFRNLLMFLKQFDVPALCMTATLPTSRRAELEGCGLVVFPGEEDRARLVDLEAKENHPRYCVEWCADEVDVIRLVREATTAPEGKRVLWVVNVVKRCQDLASRLQSLLGIDVLCYHSRFKLEDRKSAHERTVRAFQQRTQSVVAVTTQVCEMSLDLDADILVTELAPSTALVQRFGRANRHLARGPDFRARILVTPTPDALPYASEDLVTARRFVDEIAGTEVSQRRLAEAMLLHSPAEAKMRESARFLNSGYYAVPGSLREESDHLASCVLDSDLEGIAARLRQREPIDGYILPAPRRSVLHEAPRPPELPKHLSIVLGAEYDRVLGFLGGTAS